MVRVSEYCLFSFFFVFRVCRALVCLVCRAFFGGVLTGGFRGWLRAPLECTRYFMVRFCFLVGFLDFVFRGVFTFFIRTRYCVLFFFRSHFSVADSWVPVRFRCKIRGSEVRY